MSHFPSNLGQTAEDSGKFLEIYVSSKVISVGRDTHFCLNTTTIRIYCAKNILQSNSLNSGSFLYNSGRPGDHAPFLETPGNSGRLGRSDSGDIRSTILKQVT